MRKVHFALSGLVAVAVVVQFYLAGVGVFSMPEDELFGIHGWNGRIVLPVLILLNLGAAALARGRTVKLAAAMLGLLVAQTVLFLLAGVLTGATPPPDGYITTAGTIMLSFHVIIGLGVLAVSLVLLRRTYGLAFGSRDGVSRPAEERQPTAP